MSHNKKVFSQLHINVTLDLEADLILYLGFKLRFEQKVGSNICSLQKEIKYNKIMNKSFIGMKRNKVSTCKWMLQVIINN